MTHAPLDVLADLHSLVGSPGYEVLAGHAVGLSKSSVGNLLTGRTKPRRETVAAFISACLAYSKAHRFRGLAADQREQSFWQSRYEAARRPADQAVDRVVRDYLAVVGERFGRLALDTLIPLNDQDEHPPMWLRQVFVGQDVRADPPPVDLPKDVWRRVVDAGYLAASDAHGGVDREVLDRLHRSYQQRPRRSVLGVVAHPSSIKTVLLGDPGSGKSTLARYLALALAGGVALPAELEPLRGVVPLVVELRVYISSSQERDFLDLVAHLYDTEHFGLPRATVEALLTSGRSLVVFDGLDEVFDPALRETITKRIIGFTGKYPQAKVIVTSRLVGYQRALLDTAGFAHHKLEDLDRDQIGAFVDRWYGTAFPDDPGEVARMCSRLLSAVDGARAVGDLAGNPLLLTILAIIGRRRELPRDRRAVYQHAVTVLVQHWDIDKHLAGIRVDEGLSTLVEEDKLELLRRVARRMQDAPAGLAGNHIPGTDLTEEFERYLRDDLELPAHRARPVANAMLEQFRHRNFILSRFGAGVYGFVHRAFLEYLAADDVVRRFTHERSLDESDLVALYANRWKDPAWHEVLRHVAGMLNENFARLVIEHLLNLNPTWRQSPDSLPHHLVLAVQCLGEIRRLGALTPLSRAVAKAVTDLLMVAGHRQRNFDSKLTKLIESSVVPALSEFGPYWAGREVFQEWYTAEHAVLVRQARDWAPDVPTLATRIAALLAGNDPEFRDTLREQARTAPVATLRVAAINGLACGNITIDDVRLLRGLVEDDEDDTVRAAALTHLIPAVAKDEPTAIWLRGLTPREEGSALPAAVVSALATGWADHPDTLPWLYRHHIETPTVVRVLATEWSGHEGVLAWLRELVASDEPISSRRQAVWAIGQGWGQVAGVRKWLAELAEHSGSDVRAEALVTIGARWWHEPEVIRWLRSQIEAERDQGVRNPVIDQLCEVWTGEEADAQLRIWGRTDRDDGVRQTVINATAERASGPELRGWLREVFTTEHGYRPRTAAVRHLIRAGEDWAWVEAHLLRNMDASVRLAAVAAITAHSAKDDLLAWLKDIATSDASWFVRENVLKVIAAGWPREPATLEWLQEQAASGDVRGVALTAIATGWPDQPGTLDRLRAKVHAQASHSARWAALEVVVEDWSAEPTTPRWLLTLAETDVDQDIRASALTAVINTPPEGIPLLAWLCDKATNDWGTQARETAIKAIAKHWGDGAAVRDWVVDRLRSMDYLGSWRSSGTIRDAWLRDPAVRAHLVDLAEQEPNSAFRKFVVEAVTEGRADLPAVSAWLRSRAVADPAPAVRMAAMRQAARHTADTEWLGAISATDPDPEIRASATALLAASPEELQEAYLAATNPVERRTLLWELMSAWAAREDARAWVRQLAESAGDAQDRASALNALSAYWEWWPGAFDWLWERASDDSPLVRRTALAALANSWQYLPDLVDRLTAVADDDWEVRLAVVRSTEEWPPGAGAEQWLREQARNDIDPAVRAVAVTYAADAAPEDGDLIPWLRSVVASDEDWFPRSMAVEVAAVFGARLPGIVEWLREVAIGDKDALVRSVAVEWWALGWGHDPAVRNELSRLGAEDPRASQRLAVTRALAQSRPGDTEVTAWLREQAQDPDPGVAAAAERELGDRAVIPALVLEAE
ncbi:HEAT repeat domain-containing protein [Actinosynnema sp. CA-299493]